TRRPARADGADADALGGKGHRQPLAADFDFPGERARELLHGPDSFFLLASYRGRPGLDRHRPPRLERHGARSTLPRLKEMVMRRIPCLVVLALLPGPAAAGDAEPRTVIERAIKAHGGTDALTKSLNCTRTDAGVQESLGRQITLAGTLTRSLPDRVRLKVEV